MIGWPPRCLIQPCTTMSVRMDQLPASTVPIRSRASFVELLCGCMVSPDGWVMRAISAIARRRHGTTYYKLLGRGSLRTVRLAGRLFALVLKVLPCDVLTLVIDDTLVPRSSEQAPGCAYRHDHRRKINRLYARRWGIEPLFHNFKR